MGNVLPSPGVTLSLMSVMSVIIFTDLHGSPATHSFSADSHTLMHLAAGLTEGK